MRASNSGGEFWPKSFYRFALLWVFFARKNSVCVETFRDFLATKKAVAERAQKLKLCKQPQFEICALKENFEQSNRRGTFAASFRASLNKQSREPDARRMQKSGESASSYISETITERSALRVWIAQERDSQIAQQKQIKSYFDAKHASFALSWQIENFSRSALFAAEVIKVALLLPATNRHEKNVSQIARLLLCVCYSEKIKSNQIQLSAKAAFRFEGANCATKQKPPKPQSVFRASIVAQLFLLKSVYFRLRRFALFTLLSSKLALLYFASPASAPSFIH